MVHLWRIASDTRDYTAPDMEGKGAAHLGGRWNRQGEFVTYASVSIALAAWEALAHLGRGTLLPLKRYLVRIDVPDASGAPARWPRDRHLWAPKCVAFYTTRGSRMSPHTGRDEIFERPAAVVICQQPLGRNRHHG